MAGLLSTPRPDFSNGLLNTGAQPQGLLGWNDIAALAQYSAEQEIAKRKADAAKLGQNVTNAIASVPAAVGAMVAYPGQYMQGKATGDPVQWATNTALSVMGGGSAFPAAANDLRMGIKAYHGSPYDFEKFNISKIGTGEGAQAYGHGLYFAENPNVAADYKKNLTTMQLSSTQRNLDAYGGDIDKALAGLRSEIDRLRNLPNGGGDPARQARQISIKEQAIGQLQALKTSGQYNLGKTYEVSINAHPDEFLNWDLPLSQQSSQVQNAMAKAGLLPAGFKDLSYLELKVASDGPNSWYAQQLNYVKGLLEKPMSEFAPKTAEAAQALKDAGIKGIRYADQGSRGTGGGTSNYVVFDDKTVEILKKYGLAGLIGGATLGPGVAQDVSRAMGQPAGTRTY